MPKLSDLCHLLGGTLHGSPDVQIDGAASLEGAGPSDLAPIDSRKFLDAAKASKAGAFLVSKGLEEALDRPCIVTDFPLVALNSVMESLGLVADPPAPGVHTTAVIDPTAQVGEDCHIAPYVVISAGAKIGARCFLHPHVVVGREVLVGDECILEAGVVVQEGAELGNRVWIGSNACISRQGFGYAPGPEGPVKLHHIGRVVIEDGVHLGAGTMVDRARFDETRIGRGTALDNLVQIGHNAIVGSYTFVSAQVGLAGNARVGSQCEIGGQVGIANYGGVGDRCRVGAQAGLMQFFGDDRKLLGSPADDFRTTMRIFGAMRDLVDKSPKGDKKR